MSMAIRGGNQHKAERIARDLVKDLTVMDIDWTIVEGIGLDGEQRLCSALDGNFLKHEKRLSALEHKIRPELNDELWNEYESLRLQTSARRQQASFALGYAAALRLFGITPKPRGKKGGRS